MFNVQFGKLKKHLSEIDKSTTACIEGKMYKINLSTVESAQFGLGWER